MIMNYFLGIGIGIVLVNIVYLNVCMWDGGY